MKYSDHKFPVKMRVRGISKELKDQEGIVAVNEHGVIKAKFGDSIISVLDSDIEPLLDREES
jgi:hypothetical protein